MTPNLCPCGKPSSHLDVDVESREWACRVPNPEAVPDDLLRDIGEAIYSGSQGAYLNDAASALLASEPMQRLKAAWTAETINQQVKHHDVAVDSYDRAIRERDEARAELAQARKTLDRVIDERNQAEDKWLTRSSELSRLQAEVEGLRAGVPDLPHVRRLDQNTLLVGDEKWYARLGMATQVYRRGAAARLAVAAFLDREVEERAADTTTDDDPSLRDLARVLQRYNEGPKYVHDGGPGFEEYLADAQAIFDRRARARTNGEGAQLSDHRCDNCDGIAIGTCVFNPNRAADDAVERGEGDRG